MKEENTIRITTHQIGVFSFDDLLYASANCSLASQFDSFVRKCISLREKTEFFCVLQRADRFADVDDVLFLRMIVGVIEILLVAEAIVRLIAATR